LTGLLAFAAGYALYTHVDATVMGMPFPVFTGLFHMAAVVSAAAVSFWTCHALVPPPVLV
jgi:hypothetical protein